MVACAQWAFQVPRGSVETSLRWGDKRLHHFKPIYSGNGAPNFNRISRVYRIYYNDDMVTCKYDLRNDARYRITKSKLRGVPYISQKCNEFSPTNGWYYVAHFLPSCAIFAWRCSPNGLWQIVRGCWSDDWECRHSYAGQAFKITKWT